MKPNLYHTGVYDRPAVIGAKRQRGVHSCNYFRERLTARSLSFAPEVTTVLGLGLFPYAAKNLTASDGTWLLEITQMWEGGSIWSLSSQ